jgi:hypothetical protein
VLVKAIRTDEAGRAALMEEVTLLNGQSDIGTGAGVAREAVVPEMFDLSFYLPIYNVNGMDGNVNLFSGVTRLTLTGVTMQSRVHTLGLLQMTSLTHLVMDRCGQLVS